MWIPPYTEISSTINYLKVCALMSVNICILKYFARWYDWDLKDRDHPQALVELTFNCVRRFVPKTTFSPWEFLLILNHGGVLKLNLCCAYVATFLGGWNNKATGLEIDFPPYAANVVLVPLGLPLCMGWWFLWNCMEIGSDRNKEERGWQWWFKLVSLLQWEDWCAWKCMSCRTGWAT